MTDYDVAVALIQVIARTRTRRIWLRSDLWRQVQRSTVVPVIGGALRYSGCVVLERSEFHG